MVKDDYNDVMRPSRAHPDLPVRQMDFYVRDGEVVHRLQFRIDILRYDNRCRFNLMVFREIHTEENRQF